MKGDVDKNKLAYRTLVALFPPTSNPEVGAAVPQETTQRQYCSRLKNCQV